MPASSLTLFLSAMVLTLVGVWVQWRAPWYRMSVEESVKDGKLTHEQAQRRMGVIEKGRVVLTVVGVATLVASLLLAAD